MSLESRACYHNIAYTAVYIFFVDNYEYLFILQNKNLPEKVSLYLLCASKN